MGVPNKHTHTHTGTLQIYREGVPLASYATVLLTEWKSQLGQLVDCLTKSLCMWAKFIEQEKGGEERERKRRKRGKRESRNVAAWLAASN